MRPLKLKYEKERDKGMNIKCFYDLHVIKEHESICRFAKSSPVIVTPFPDFLHMCHSYNGNRHCHSKMLHCHQTAAAAAVVDTHVVEKIPRYLIWQINLKTYLNRHHHSQSIDSVEVVVVVVVGKEAAARMEKAISHDYNEILSTQKQYHFTWQSKHLQFSVNSHEIPNI